MNEILQLSPEYRDYVWGGQRLRPGQLTAESWMIYENDLIKGGDLDGKTLAWVAENYGEELLGSRALQETGKRFPLLIKLLDSAEWLSLQVHPNNEMAEELEGPGHFGKTEAWYVVDAIPGAQLIAGFKPGVTTAEADSAIRDDQHGAILDLVQYQPVKTGETVYIPAGTIHALGPGLMIYEVQQTSDLTYRVYDWGRPQSENRPLHIEKSIKAANPELNITPKPAPELTQGEKAGLLKTPYFTLNLLIPGRKAIPMDTGQESFHALTVIEGQATIKAGKKKVKVEQFQSVLIPASTGEYQVSGKKGCKVLKASV